MGARCLPYQPDDQTVYPGPPLVVVVHEAAAATAGAEHGRMASAELPTEFGKRPASQKPCAIHSGNARFPDFMTAARLHDAGSRQSKLIRHGGDDFCDHPVREGRAGNRHRIVEPCPAAGISDLQPKLRAILGRPKTIIFRRFQRPRECRGKGKLLRVVLPCTSPYPPYRSNPSIRWNRLGKEQCRGLLLGCA